MPKYNEEQFDGLLENAMEELATEEAEDAENAELQPYSRRFKIKMNRLFRERVGGTFLPFPEEDNAYERLRSKIVIAFRINEIVDRLKGRNK